MSVLRVFDITVGNGCYPVTESAQLGCYRTAPAWPHLLQWNFFRSLSLDASGRQRMAKGAMATALW